MKLLAPLIPLVAAMALSETSHGSIIITAPSSSAGSMQITQDISFTMIGGPTPVGSISFVLDELLVADGGPNHTSAVSPTLALTLNGSALGVSSATVGDDSIGLPGDITANDGYIAVAPSGMFFFFSAGDILTLKAGTYALAANADFNPGATKTFTGSLFVVDTSTTTRISSIAAVPEPSYTVASLTIAAVSLMGRRRRLA